MPLIPPTYDSLLTGPSYQRYWIPLTVVGGAFLASWYFHRTEKKAQGNWGEFKAHSTENARAALGMPTYLDVYDENERDEYQKNHTRYGKPQQARRVVSNNNNNNNNNQAQQQHDRDLQKFVSNGY